MSENRQWHINPNTGNPGSCSVEKCPVEHYPTFEQAQKAYENAMNDFLMPVHKKVKQPNGRFEHKLIFS